MWNMDCYACAYQTMENNALKMYKKNEEIA